MRKVKLCVNDFALFGQEVDATEIEYFNKHKDAFRRMWKEQGPKFWERYVLCFQAFTVNYGAIKPIPGKMRAYDELFQEVFDHIKKDFVNGRATSAKTLVMDTFMIILHSSLVPYLESKSYSKDPFYHRETRETYRRLFGAPEDKASYFKMYLMCSVYLKFGYSVSVCLRRWMQAADQDENDDSYYTEPTNLPVLPSEVVPQEGDQEEDSDMQVFLEEKIRGNPYGPMFITDWRKGDPRFNDSSNPLYSPNSDKRSDWRDSVSFGQFKEFLAYVREERDKKNGVSATKKLQRLTKELAQDQTDVEILEKLLKAGSAAANESVQKCKGKKSKLNGIGPDKDPDNKGPRLTLNYGPKDGTEEGPKMTVEVQFKPGDKADITIQMDRKDDPLPPPPPGALKALPPPPRLEERKKESPPPPVTPKKPSPPPTGAKPKSLPPSPPTRNNTKSTKPKLSEPKVTLGPPVEKCRGCDPSIDSSVEPARRLTIITDATGFSGVNKVMKLSDNKTAIIVERKSEVRTGSTQTSDSSNGSPGKSVVQSRKKRTSSTSADCISGDTTRDKGTSPMDKYDENGELLPSNENNKKTQDEIDDEKNESDSRAAMFQMMWDLTIANLPGSPLNMLPYKPPMFLIPNKENGEFLRPFILEFNDDYTMAYTAVKEMDKHMSELKEAIVKESKKIRRNDTYFQRRGREYRILRAMHRHTNKKLELFYKATNLMDQEFRKVKKHLKEKKLLTESKFNSTINSALLDLLVQTRQSFRMAYMVATDIAEEFIFLKYESVRQVNVNLKIDKGVPHPKEIYGYFLYEKYEELTNPSGTRIDCFRSKKIINDLWKNVEYNNARSKKGDWQAMLRIAVDTDITEKIIKSLEGIARNHSLVYEVINADEDRDPEPDLEIASWESSVQPDITEIPEEELKASQAQQESKTKSKAKLQYDDEAPLGSLVLDAMSQAMKKGGSMSYKDPPKIEMKRGWYQNVFRVCANCGVQASSIHVFKICLRCKELKAAFPRCYCDKSCQVEDWNKRHRDEHKENKIEKEKKSFIM